MTTEKEGLRGDPVYCQTRFGDVMCGQGGYKTFTSFSGESKSEIFERPKSNRVCCQITFQLLRTLDDVGIGQWTECVAACFVLMAQVGVYPRFGPDLMCG